MTPTNTTSSTRHRNRYWLSALVMLSGAFVIAPACVYNPDHRCGENQEMYGNDLRCVCIEGYAYTAAGCVPCGAHEEPGADGCYCETGYFRPAEGATCQRMPSDQGATCNDDAPCVGDFDHCEFEAEDEDGYCTTTECESTEDCAGDYVCDTDASPTVCRRPPLGLGMSCSTAEDCEDTDATYCDPVTQTCLVTDCDLDDDDCFLGYECCDLSDYGIDEPFCAPEGGCVPPPSAQGAECDDDSPCVGDFDTCEEEGDDPGYCTNTCEGPADCTGGYACDTSVTPSICRRPPEGLWQSCEGPEDCAGTAATYCDPNLRICMIEGCNLDDDDCFVGTECCDLSSTGVSEPLCVTVGYCPAAGQGAECSPTTSCVGDFDTCEIEVEGESGYCTNTCEDPSDCTGGYACDTSVTPSICRRPPAGLGRTCTADTDCEDTAATYCEPLLQTCMVQGCSVDEDDCFVGYECCDKSDYGVDEPYCMPVGLCPTPGPGQGDECDDDAACSGEFDHCEVEGSGPGYCTKTGCEDSNDCRGSYGCDTSVSPSVCVRPPEGLGIPCEGPDDCAGTDATYCDAFFSHTCMIENCNLDDDDCFLGYECCDLSAFGTPQPLCVPEGGCQ